MRANGLFGGKGLWHKAAPAVARDREITPCFDTLVVDAKCPHYNSDFTYRHFEVVSLKRNVSPAAPRTRLLQGVLQFKNHKLFAWLVLKSAWLISFCYPWFGYLKYTVRAKARTDNNTVTGLSELHSACASNGSRKGNA